MARLSWLCGVAWLSWVCLVTATVWLRRRGPAAPRLCGEVTVAAARLCGEVIVGFGVVLQAGLLVQAAADWVLSL